MPIFFNTSVTGNEGPRQEHPKKGQSPMRKLASIAAIAATEPIPDSDRLDVVTLEGKAWRIVTGRNEFHPGDRAVYFEIDSALLADHERYAFLRERCLRTWSDKHGNAQACSHYSRRSGAQRLGTSGLQ